MSVPDWLATAELMPVWRSLRRPLEQGHRTSRVGVGLPRESRHALSGVLGAPLPASGSLVLAELSADLQARAGLGLRELVERLTGPLRDPEAERARRAQPLAVLAAVDPAWAVAVRTGGLLTRASDPLAVAHAAVEVRAALPCTPRLRTRLAAELIGDAHALDDGSALAAVVLRGLAPDRSVPGDAAGRRALWASVGVLADTVSATVLTLGLRPVADGPPEQLLSHAARLGEPVHLTQRQLASLEPALAAGTRVLVCENPAVLEAVADRFGGTHPVVCTSGWPAPVAVELLRALGAELLYHGDLDWAGVAICAWLVERCGVRPWRMSAEDYLAAPSGRSLQGSPRDTPWDPALAAAMAERGVAVHEEHVLDELMDALVGWSTEDAPDVQ